MKSSPGGSGRAGGWEGAELQELALLLPRAPAFLLDPSSGLVLGRAASTAPAPGGGFVFSWPLAVPVQLIWEKLPGEGSGARLAPAEPCQGAACCDIALGSVCAAPRALKPSQQAPGAVLSCWELQLLPPSPCIPEGERDSALSGAAAAEPQTEPVRALSKQLVCLSSELPPRGES